MDMDTRTRRDEAAAPPFTYELATQAFLLRCQAKNLSRLTVGWYKVILATLGRFLAAHGIDRPRDITPTLLREHLQQLRANGFRSGTVYRAYGALRCFLGFLSRERLIPANPMALVEKPRQERRFVQALTLEQVRALLAQPDPATYAGLRVWTIMVLILDTGLRISEVLGLRRDQVDFQANVLRVLGKGGREREVPFGTAAKQALWQYAAKVGEVPGQDLFFVDQFGRGLNARWLQEQVHNYGSKAGIQGVRVSPHTLRHSFATLYILNGGDAFSLQKVLGHSSLDMVRVYVDLANRDVALQHRKYSPIDCLGIVPGERRRVQLR